MNKNLPEKGVIFLNCINDLDLLTDTVKFFRSKYKLLDTALITLKVNSSPGSLLGNAMCTRVSTNLYIIVLFNMYMGKHHDVIVSLDYLASSFKMARIFAYGKGTCYMEYSIPNTVKSSVPNLTTVYQTIAFDIIPSIRTYKFKEFIDGN